MDEHTTDAPGPAGLTHPREQFQMYGLAPPSGEWGYCLDDYNVSYAAGWWWPFSKPSVRLAPDTAPYAWNSQYVKLDTTPIARHVALAAMQLHLRHQGLGTATVAARVQIDMRAREVTVLARDIAGPLCEHAVDNGRKVLAFLLRHRARRRRGHTEPVTAADLFGP